MADIKRQRRVSNAATIESTVPARLVASQRIDLQPLIEDFLQVRDASHEKPEKRQSYENWWIQRANQLFASEGPVFFRLSKESGRGGRREHYPEMSGTIARVRDFGFINVYSDNSVGSNDLLNPSGTRHEFFFRWYSNPPRFVYQQYNRRGELDAHMSYGNWELIPPFFYRVPISILEEQTLGLLALNAHLRTPERFGPFLRRALIGEVGVYIGPHGTRNPFGLTMAKQQQAVKQQEEEEKPSHQI